jgi:hypothetical protein
MHTIKPARLATNAIAGAPSRARAAATPTVASLRGVLLALACVLATPASAYDLAQHLWRDRLLMVVAPTAGDAQAQALLQRLGARADAVADRRLVIFELYRDHGRAGGQPLAGDQVAGLRRDLGATADTRAMVLLGLDGGIKRRTGLDAPLREIFALIDGMPMRQQEIREKRRAGLPVTPP